MGLCKGKWERFSSLSSSKDIIARCRLVYEGAKANIKQVSRNASLRVKQEDTPEGSERLGSHPHQSTHDPMKVTGPVLWSLPTLTWPRHSSSFLVLNLY